MHKFILAKLNCLNCLENAKCLIKGQIINAYCFAKLPLPGHKAMSLPGMAFINVVRNKM